MGFFKKIFKGIKKVFKKIGKFIKKQFTRIGKVFNKLGIVGTIALAVIAPYALPALTSFAGAAAASGNALVSGFGKLLGTGLKFASGASKVIGSVGKAVSNTFSRIVGKVGGEFLNKIGIKNFMGKDLTKLDSWGTIWKNTQADFAGIKNAWSTGTQAFQEQFDIAKANKQAESRSLLDVDQVGGSTEMAVREGAYTDPTRFGEQGDLLSGPYSPVEQGNYIRDPITGEITVKPAMTPIEQVDIFDPDTKWVPDGTIDPITGKPNMKAVGPSAGFEPALNPTVQGKDGRSLLMPDYQGASNVETVSKLKPAGGMMFNIDETEVVTAPGTTTVPTAGTSSVGGEIVSGIGSKLKGAVVDKFKSAILGSEESTGESTGGRTNQGIAPTLPENQVQPGSQAQAFGISIDPQGPWAQMIAEAMRIETGFRVDFGGSGKRSYGP